MSDVIDELRDAYAARRAPGPPDVEALILGATVRGDTLRRVRRRRQSSAVALVVVAALVGATAIVISSHSDNRLRVSTTVPTTVAVPSLPAATTREFPDLGRLEKYVLGVVDSDSQKPSAVRAEVVQSTANGFDRSNGTDKPASVNVAIYLVQLTGTEFTCHDCFSSPNPALEPAMRIAWDPAAHTVVGTALGRPADLAPFGRVYEMVLRDTRPTTPVEACTQLDLDRPGLPMPAPRAITAPMGLEQLSRLDPAPGARPAISAAQAWATLTHNQPAEARSAELLLGYYASFLGGAQSHTLAWVLHLGHLAYTGVSGGVVLPGVSTTVPPVCQFTNAFLILNATTGTGIVDSYGG